MSCCNRTAGPKDRLLAQLAGLVALPEDAQLWGPRDQWEWRVVDRHGRETVPLIASRHRVSDCLAASSLVVSDDGGTIAVGLLQ